ncbi:SAV_2336 N-terminal domain-related protein [Streptomyces sp. NPDC057617]|uniref:SAV_2336 N-terminal domain-related protein n=1 Tax=Streptomyces sp. NPDC057617 TaxID=3346184 RepID=UPI0036857CFF
MTSDAAHSAPSGAGSASAELVALREVLTAVGGEPPTGRELAEALWLAARMRSGRGAGSGPELGLRPGVEAPVEAPPQAVTSTPPRGEPDQPDSPPTAQEPPTAPPPPDRVELRTPTPPLLAPPPALPGGESTVLAPAPPMLSRPLALQRALRPLRRTVPSAHERELDEAGTAHRIAALGVPRGRWLPVLRPAPERWLHLRLVLDDGPTMAMWRPLARDLFTAFGQTGAFRTVEWVRLGADGTVPPGQWSAGRTAVLVISDAMGPQWREGPAGRRWYRTLRNWARSLPVTLVQPLPERMWQHTAPAPVPGLFSTPGPGAPNGALRFRPYDGEARGVPVPVLEPAPEWLAHWAGLVASPGGGEFPGAAALLPSGPWPEPRDGGEGLVPGDAPAEELVLRFRSVASPQAVRLASHLAVGAPHLPVMRLVQAAVETRPQPQHLAEVVLSGMLTAVPGPAGSYAFRPGVRDLLLSALPRTGLARTVGLLERVGAEIEVRAGTAPGEFRALLGGGGGNGTGAGDAAGRAAGDAFALVSRESVRLLRGPEPVREPEPEPTSAPEPEPAPDTDGRLLARRYRLLEILGRGEQSVVWRAYDQRENRPVAVKLLHPGGPQVKAVSTRAQNLHLREIRAAAALRHPGITPIHDFGVADDTTFFLVMELLNGRSLDELMAESGHRPLPVADVADIGHQVLDALSHAHRQGIWHRYLTPANIVRLTDGTVKIRGFGIARTGLDSTRTSQVSRMTVARGAPKYMSPEQIGGDGVDQRSDLYSLGCVLYELATGEPPFDYEDTWRTLLAHRDSAPVPPRQLRPGLPAALETAMLALLAKDPADRGRGANALMSGTLAAAWEYGVLGPLKALQGRQDRTPTTPAGRIVLGRLLLTTGHSTTVEALGEALGGVPPREVIEAVDGLIAEGHAIEVAEGVYRLRLDTELDFTTALRVTVEAKNAADSGDHRRALGLYEAALSQWYGEPLADAEGGWAHQQREKLQDLRQLLGVARDMARFMAKAHRVGSSSAVPSTGMHLTIRSGVARDQQQTHHGVLSALRDACAETLGDPTDFDRDLTLRMVARAGDTVPDVLRRLEGPFIEILMNALSPLSFTQAIPMSVLLHTAPTEAGTVALGAALPFIESATAGEFTLLIGLPDAFYQQAGTPSDYQPYEADGADGTTYQGWYTVIRRPYSKPERRTLLRRLLDGFGNTDG